MSFISYAQNFEDVMLWRALKHVENGFYIDVGACSPDFNSVTKAFYERGWHGINVEPHPELHKQLEYRRFNDINLQVAVGKREDSLTMNFLTSPGLSTLDDAIAQKHKESGWDADRQEVRVTTLSAIWSEHVPQGQEVHFLKVDVEGFEEDVLSGAEWVKYRPWIVVVEATLPMSQVESHEPWEPILLEADYEFVYMDGLNRFYVDKEHPELIPSFKYPPNVFDEFKLAELEEAEARAVQAEARAVQAEARAVQAEARAAQVEAHAAQVEVRVAQAEEQLVSLLVSKSWRITAPLRFLMSLVKRV